MRSIRAFVVAAALAIAGAFLVVAPAHAASQDGLLMLQGPGGSAYSYSDVTSRSGTPGATLSYTVEVFSYAQSQAQYRVVVDSDIPADVYKGSLLLTKLASSNDGYYTAPIAPNTAEALTVKVKLPSSYAGQATFATNITLYATDGTVLDHAHLLSNLSVKSLAEGPNEFVTANSQPKVGGALSQVMTANTIAIGGTATFTFTVQNTDVTPAFEQFDLVSVRGCAPVTTTVSNSVSGKQPSSLQVYVKGNSTATITVTVKLLEGCDDSAVAYQAHLTDETDADPANWVEAPAQTIVVNRNVNG